MLERTTCIDTMRYLCSRPAALQEPATSKAQPGHPPMAKNDWCGAQGIVGSMPWIAFGWLTLYMQMLVSCLPMTA